MLDSLPCNLGNRQPEGWRARNKEVAIPCIQVSALDRGLLCSFVQSTMSFSSERTGDYPVQLVLAPRTDSLIHIQLITVSADTVQLSCVKRPSERSIFFLSPNGRDGMIADVAESEPLIG